MINEEKCIVMDLDGTLCEKKSANQHYADLLPRPDVLAKLKAYHAEGFYIIISTARNMRTYGGNLGRINANTAKTIVEWLDKYEVPYDELHFGKPWQGRGGFYVDDKAIRPDEFVGLSYEQILEIIVDE